MIKTSQQFSLRRKLKAPALLLVALAAAGVLVACSGAKAASGNNSSPAAVTESNGFGQGGGGGFRGLFNNPQVKQCLDAAGITLPTRTFTGPRPSFSPDEHPAFTRSPGSGPFGGQNSAEFQKIREALRACGITLPSRGPRADFSGQPSAAPTA